MESYRNRLFIVGWLCFMSHRQRGLLQTAPPFTVPCEGRAARKIHRFHLESNPGPSHDSPLPYLCATQAPLLFIMVYVISRFVCCLLWFNFVLKSEVISRRCLLHCNNCALTNVLPHRNAMLKTQEMTPHHKDTGRTCCCPIYIVVECHSGIHSYPF